MSMSVCTVCVVCSQPHTLLWQQAGHSLHACIWYYMTESVECIFMIFSTHIWPYSSAWWCLTYVLDCMNMSDRSRVRNEDQEEEEDPHLISSRPTRKSYLCTGYAHSTRYTHRWYLYFIWSTFLISSSAIEFYPGSTCLAQLCSSINHVNLLFRHVVPFSRAFSLEYVTYSALLWIDGDGFTLDVQHDVGAR